MLIPPSNVRTHEGVLFSSRNLMSWHKRGSTLITTSNVRTHKGALLSSRPGSILITPSIVLTHKGAPLLLVPSTNVLTHRGLPSPHALKRSDTHRAPFSLRHLKNRLYCLKSTFPRSKILSSELSLSPPPLRRDGGGGGGERFRVFVVVNQQLLTVLTTVGSCDL